MIRGIVCVKPIQRCTALNCRETEKMSQKTNSCQVMVCSLFLTSVLPTAKSRTLNHRSGPNPVRYGLFIVQRQMWMPVCTANVTHKTESNGISAVSKCSVDINEKRSVHSWNGLVTKNSPCPPKKYIHIFRFVSPNVNTCEWWCAKRCCTLLILTTRKLHPCNWQLWTIYNVESSTLNH